ncbi:helix-turn-helix domain-containing protein, partial [Tenacibaculum dicentrarchi]|nr:helix-turn-helix domain-containing protein [Tenacibaculum dicentrarchi]
MDKIILPEKNEYLTRKQLSELLNISINTIKSLVNKGIIPEYKIPDTRIVRYKKSEIIELF